MNDWERYVKFYEKAYGLFRYSGELGEIGNLKISPRIVSEDEAKLGKMRDALNGRHSRIEADTYTQLTEFGSIWMSDTPDEFHDCNELIKRAVYYGGDILINGLGLGCIAQVLAMIKGVNSIRIIERSDEIISLVADNLMARHQKIEIIHADALEYKPDRGERFTIVWHDIWPTICGDNYDSMKTLHRKYGRRCAWQNSWRRWEVKRAQGC